MTAKVALSLFRGWHGPTVATLLLGSAVGVRLLPTVFLVPRLFTTVDVVAPMTALAALVVAIAGFSTAQEPAEQILTTAPMRSRASNPLRVCIVLAIGVLLLGLLGSTDGAAAVSTTAALAGEGLIVASLSDIAYAWALPTLHLLAALTFGAAGRIDLAPWAWILSTHPSAFVTNASILLLVVGLLTWSIRTRWS